MESQVFKRIIEQFAAKILQRQGSTWSQLKNSLFGDNGGTRTVHQHRAPKR